MFLQFYLERQIDDARQLRSEKEQLTAELMVSVIFELADESVSKL
ncbi:hypothetical protein ACI3PF_21000 [Lactococcus lactis]